jgi:molybdate transport system substrate-binding protein
MKPLLSGCLLVVSMILAGCRLNPMRDTGQPVMLTISAASDLSPAFREIGSLFEAQTGVKTSFNFGSTGQLAQQIEQGAPVDLFAAADVSRIDTLETKGLVLPDTKKAYALGRITLWTRADGPLRLDRVEDLLQPGVQRVAIANPDHAPYGVAARQAMQSAGVWEKIQDRLVLAENAQQTLQYAQTGNVDAAIVPLSLSDQGGGRWVLVPAELHQPIIQALAIVRGTAHEREARKFADFVAGPQGQEVLRRYGFAPVGQEPSQ